MSRPKPSVRTRVRSLFGLVFVFAILSATWSALRLSIAGLGISPSSWGGGLLAFMATLIVLGAAANIAGIFIRKKHPDYFAILSEAIMRLATGDFDVSLSFPNRVGGNRFFGKVADEINLLAQSLKRMEDMRQEFISNVSHEIQSPLTSIGGFAKALRDKDLSEETRLRYLEIIEEESGRLSRLSEGLLRLTVLEVKELELDRGPVALDEPIRRAIIAAEPQWVAKALELDLDLERVEAYCDEAMLAQVWTNLLHNAIKFSERGSRISISLRRSGEYAVARFADEGIGIAPEDLGLVFDRFFKADRSRSKAEASSGTGLGLAIAKKIVELHGGTIRAESAGLDAGSVFTVELPTTLGDRNS